MTRNVQRKLVFGKRLLAWTQNCFRPIVLRVVWAIWFERKKSTALWPKKFNLPSLLLKLRELRYQPIGYQRRSQENWSQPTGGTITDCLVKVWKHWNCHLYIGLVVKVVLQKLFTKTFSRSVLLLGKSHWFLF